MAQSFMPDWRRLAVFGHQYATPRCETSTAKQGNKIANSEAARVTRILSDEARSLMALRRLGNSEATSFPALDAVCRLVAEHFRVPIAVISVTSGEWQVFIGRFGLDCPGTLTQGSICSQAVVEDGVLVVEDARKDPRFAGNPLVVGGPYARFYAGVPLVHKSGVRLGTLFIVDQQPGTFSEGDREALRIFAWLANAKLGHLEAELRVDAVHASEARWRLALQMGRMIAFDVDLETGTAILSDHARELIGFTVGLYADFVDAIHPHDRAQAQAIVEQAIATATPFEMEFRLVRPDGRIVWLSQSGGLADGPNQEAGHLTGVCIDITEQKLLQQALEESEERAREFAAVSSDWLWETDENLRFTLMLGGPEDARYGPSGMLGKTRWEYAGADPKSQPWKEHIELHKLRLPFRNFEYEVHDEAGELRWISTSGRPFFDHEGRFLGYRGAASDQSDRKRLEAKLQQAQRMEAIGQLSGGVAHDFNNLLTIILGNAEMLTERLASDDKLHPLAALILSAAERGADLTDRLLAFARRQALEPVSISVNAAVERMAGILQRSVGEHIRLELSLADDLHWAHVDAALLESTILNLAVNARDAMVQGGTMTIATSNLVVDCEAGEEFRDVAPGDYVEISVTDTGVGMSPEVLQRVFEPFFTTKEVGKGSGLGLPMAQGFARQSGGQVTVQSRPGCGTSVSLVLPRSTSAPSARDRITECNGLTGGSERILVVEDEPDVRRFVVEQLSSLGYETEVAGDGPSALAVLQSAKSFDLLFTDVVLPLQMNGLELADKARAICPQIKVIFSSGYSAQISAFADVRELGSMVLLKPYRRRDLAAMVRQVLDN
jgi:PAS domain S-box-containing protein